ncbi:YeeE/YedE family protein [Foetidibacter luteolus]|uniref:YeeE/YedE family protein n=1 Tax=Foetidibacter luteolus TaxID=2608880 RepID=UPI00129C0630|nr:YeeE/YedE thiosulfate transporter family protein [Foetidibacter luteolus]
MTALAQQPWPWYVAGVIIGLTVPALLILGNKHFGISAIFRHACAACLPGNVKFFQYNLKKETWNFFFIAGIIIGAVIASQLLASPQSSSIHPQLKAELAGYGITDTAKLAPAQLFSFQNLLTVKGFIILIGGGFLIGFGSRYAGGCTSGHAIMGLSNLQWPSLVATIMFMAGGFVMANLIMPFILRL